MRKWITAIALLIFALGFSQNEDLFEKGNSAYQEGNYESAIQQYEKILDNGEASAEVYYNLGNAHYKLNHIAPSIYYFEKALQLDPADEDIKNNIAFARNMAIDDIETVEDRGLSQSLNGLIATFSAGSWAGIAIFFSILFVALFLLYYYTPKPLFKRIFLGVAVISVILCVASIIFGYQQQSFIQDNKYAIIFSEEADVRDEPNLRGESSFQLHEGTKAKILENFQEWTRIELANGAQGWTDSSNLKRL